MVGIVELKSKTNIVNVSKQMENFFRVKSAHLLVSAVDRLLCRPTDVQSSPRKRPALFGNRATNTSYADSSNAHLCLR